MTIAMEPAAFGQLNHMPSQTVGALSEELIRRDKSFADIKVHTDNLEMDSDTGDLIVNNRSYALREHAFGQLANRLNIPTPYLKKCEPDLQAENVNRWMAKQDKKLLLRTDGSEIRAVLSHRYRPINNLDLMNWLKKEIGTDSPIRYELNDQYMNLQVVRGKNLDNNADILHRGVFIRNSEVGAACVEIGAMVYRTICLNGLIMSGGKWSYERRHIGKENLIYTVQEAFSNAIEHARKAKSDLDGTRGIKVQDPEKVLNRIASRYELSEAEATAVSTAFKIEPEDSLFGVINALTRAANESTLTLDSRHNLQKVGGRITELSATGKWIDN